MTITHHRAKQIREELTAAGRLWGEVAGNTPEIESATGMTFDRMPYCLLTGPVEYENGDRIGLFLLMARDGRWYLNHTEFLEQVTDHRRRRKDC